MVQYYRDMWAKRSEMLAPLTDLVGACGERKTTKKNKTKKLPWRWDPIHQQAFDNVKATIARDIVPTDPDFTKLFEIYKLIPKWEQTLFGNRESPYGNICVSLPISVRGFPIWS